MELMLGISKEIRLAVEITGEAFREDDDFRY
jgi:hypothetical protein